jgi:hypothetical protein
VRTRDAFLGLLIVALLAIPALADLPCQPASAPPVTLTIGAILDQVFTSFVQNGISILFVAALAVVGLPWMMAGLAMALLQLPRRKS